MLLRRGDAWYEGLGTPRNGRSAREPAAIAAYGEGAARPQLRPRGKQSGLRFDIHRGFHDIAVVGLEFYACQKDPQSDDFDPTSRVRSGVQLFVGSKPTAYGRRLLIEDCCLRFCGATFMVARDAQAGATERVQQLVFRRNLVLDNYSRTSHSQGTFASRVSILIEENIYDHNGWLVRERGNRKDRGGATFFNHNTYFCDCHHVVFRGNLFLRASSIGNKWTANSGPGSARHLVIDDNLYVEGEIGISMGGNKPGPLRFKDARITNNVFLHVGRGRPTLRTLGWYLDVTDWDGGVIASNLFARQTSDAVRNVYGLKLGSSTAKGKYTAQGVHCRSVSVRSNVFHGLKHASAAIIIGQGRLLERIVFADNRIQLPGLQAPILRGDGHFDALALQGNAYYTDAKAGQWFRIGNEPCGFDAWAAKSGEQGAKRVKLDFPDPARSLEAYMALLGHKPTFDAFLAEVRGQSKARWRKELTAPAINAWFREGFALRKLEASPAK